MQKAKNPPKRVSLIGCNLEDYSAEPRPAGRC
jgi:hypothetical protein